MKILSWATAISWLIAATFFGAHSLLQPQSTGADIFFFLTMAVGLVAVALSVTLTLVAVRRIRHPEDFA
ncbi:hypothetical protein P4N68_03760 [Corynebacterium felinum]|uniref:Magnesium-transporting ATPase (P-type) n=1 Tax=Corynebacterium felinum TaxID=131318 RepID=A0ABU2B730_9CORY|nr:MULTISPECIES: hypothetical protein [Corynebacterium]MDF5820200.1 hypothetical protein [Corynebacterium felinum]MDO4761855.1 hypothetical protein [Corynebacterium sp.]MDR7354421.1 magnesium-transporting ATPase (P-type) [Corynebacterium felinum]WJY93791.1 hypothetical protein CFELI_00675 [Corynebacterium felinum]